MKTHYDICVAGFWYGYNYGSLLTGYAVYRLLKDAGKEVLMLQKPNANADDPELLEGHNVRFIEKYYDREDISPAIPYDRLEELNELCDCFMTGSDQVWNYRLSFYENMFLPFVHDDKKMISLASSFGHEDGLVPSKAKERIGSYLKRFQALSVRENFDKETLANDYKLDSTLLIDPVFCIDKRIYEEIGNTSHFENSGSYMAAYILDPTPEKRYAIQKYAEISGLKPVIILDGNADSREHNVQIMDMPDILPEAEVEDFIKIFMDAEFVLTDSYHGAAFSVIFEKPFLCIANYGRGIERFLDLFERLKIEDRLVLDPKKIPLEAKYRDPIDYDEINCIIMTEKQRALEWIKWAIDTPMNDFPDNTIPENTVTVKVKKDECMGCGACVCACPSGAARLEADEWGYYHPVIDYFKCINCGKCADVCPSLNPSENKNIKGSPSSSADSKIKEYDLQKSQHAQSYVVDIFRNIKENLDTGESVVCSGTPCQIAGLKEYLGGDYDNLYLRELECYYLPSVMFYQKYIKDEVPEKLYQRLYKNYIMCPHHCENCKYQSRLGFDLSSSQRDDFYKAIRVMSFKNASDYALKPNRGVYAPVYIDSDTPLQYYSSSSYFKFDPSIMEEHLINGQLHLMVKNGQSNKEAYASMSLTRPLNEEAEYRFSVRFRIKSESDSVVFAVKDSGSSIYQEICSYPIDEDHNPQEWIEIDFKFKPGLDIYDEIAIGASGLSGDNNYICFDYINVREI